MDRVIWIIPKVFWIWTIYSCVRYDRQRNIWLWLLIFFYIPGAVIYFLIRFLPIMNSPKTNYSQSSLRNKELWNAEVDARNIGNAYQFEKLGDLRLELGLLKEAKQAYKITLKKEPDNLRSLWCLANIAIKNNNFTGAKNYLEQLLELKPDYEYGDASLTYIKVLLELGEKELAKTLLEKEIKTDKKLEAYLLLAELYIEEGKKARGKKHLKTMLFNLRSSPRFYYRKYQHLEKKAKKILLRL